MGLKDKTGLEPGGLRNLSSIELSAIPDSGVARWTFDNDDTQSGTALDVWNNNDGTINGATTGVSGANQTHTTNEAYSFDGTDDYVQTPSLNVNTSDPFSIAVWINPDSFGTSDTILRQWVTGGSPNVFILRIQSGTLEFAIWDGSNLQGATTSDVSTGVWSHVVGTFDGSIQRLYIDATEKDTNSFTGRNTASAPIEIGRRDNNSEFYTGDIDDPRIYDKALSPSEVSDLYSTGSI